MKSNGYISRWIGGKKVGEHRVIWEQHNGPIPKGMQIDHINGIRNDNRIENLRLVTNQQNSFNQLKAKGFYWDKMKSKWRASIQLNGKTINLGYTNCMLEARAMYLRAKKELHII